MDKTKNCFVVVILALVIFCTSIKADWPQYMRDSLHCGDAPEIALQLPVKLVTQVKLNDVCMASPIVVNGMVYVVDQMGTAYAVDPVQNRIIWQSAPEEDAAMGFNTAAPCISISKSRLYYGTTGGKLHILNIADGKLIKSVNIGWPIISSPTLANNAIYLQALDGMLRSFDLDGNPRWQWDHYKNYVEPEEVTKAEAKLRGHPGSYEMPHYGGGEIVVSGTKVVTHLGWDIFALEDLGDKAKLRWCRRAPEGRDGAIPMSMAISGDTIHCAGMGVDGVLTMLQFNLLDGSSPEKNLRVSGIPGAWTTPAVRGNSATSRSCGYGRDSFMLFDSIERKQLANWTDDKQATPAITSQVLTRDHLIITSLNGDLILAPITVGSDNTTQRIKTPNAKGIGSTPAIADNTIFFGCDDGYLYGYGNGKEIEVITGNIDWITKPRSKITSGTGKQYGWVSSSGDAANNCYVDDLALKPPLKVRWAARYYGHAKSPAVANEGNDVFTVTLQRQLTCHEQTTGRMRWRVCLPPDGIEQRRGAGMALDGNDLVIPTPWGENGKIFCIDITHGKIKWEAPIGDKGTFDRASPIIANSKVAFSYTTKENSIIAAWDLATGAPAWEIKLAVNPGVSANGCAGKDIMYYTAGSEQWRWKPADETRQRGESLAIEASTGKVLWRTHELFGSATPSLDKNDTILMLEIGDGPMSGIKAINVHDGTLKWNAGRTYMTRTSIGNEYAVLRGYGGAAQKINLADGSFSKGLVKGGQLGGDTHACGAVGLTPRYSYAVTVGGLIVRDAETGEQVWQSPGFAPRACVNVSLANGRVFWPSAASGVFFCWEPQRD